ncbi:unnamed protein product [Pipistrellus nathusii]|uniref:Uncharacterized protein n=1 Tax=Pipistrellus nathusii TaxID=59473 RepID=A0ABP0ACD2_PIPNA
MEVSRLSLPKRAGGRGRGCQQTPNPEAGARTFPRCRGPRRRGGGLGIRLWLSHSHAPRPQQSPPAAAPPPRQRRPRLLPGPLPPRSGSDARPSGSACRRGVVLWGRGTGL